MKARLLLCILFILSLPLTACRQQTADPTPEPIVETIIAHETVLVVVTATPEAATAVSQITPTIAASPTAVSLATAVAQATTTAPPAATVTRPPATRLPATATAAATPPEGGPVLLYFRANVATADPGQTVQLEWASTGATRATIGYLFDFRMYPYISDLPPSGSYNYLIPVNQRNNITLFLTVVDAEEGWDMDTLTLPLTCPHPWFFSPAPNTCPVNAPRVSAGAEQLFENGYMLWEAAEQRIYILFASGSPRWAAIADTWQDGEAICQIEPIPPGRIHPVRGFGKAWCNEPGLRERLGWAMGPEVGYQTAVQSTAFDRYNSLYIRAADGGTWRLLAERSGWEKIGP